MPSDTPRRLQGLFALIGLLVLAACADARGNSIPYDGALAALNDVVSQTLATENKTAAIDKLAIKIFKMDHLTGVDPAGNISLPLIGQVQADNLTTGHFDEILTQKVGDNGRAR